MPFLKPVKEFSRTRQIENLAAKNGWHATYFGLDGSTYVGEWKDNKKCGKGRLVMKSRRILYEGDFKDNLPHGFGVFARTAPKNWKLYTRAYRGVSQAGEKNSVGSYHHKDGTYYMGSWKNGKKENYGLRWYVDGSFYAGEFSNGVCHGFGIFVRTDGNRYEGDWKDGMKDGKGIFYHLNKGQMQEGVWVKDRCIFSTISVIPFRQCAVFPTQYPVTETYVAVHMYKDREDKILEGKTKSCLSLSGSSINKDKEEKN